jgi:hypothetical protein
MSLMRELLAHPPEAEVRRGGQQSSLANEWLTRLFGTSSGTD